MAVENFAVKLSRAIADGVPLIYFDEASFNLWLRNKRTWTPKVEPVKYPLGRNRGKGITVMGAISQFMGKPLFSMEKSTNSVAFQRFLRLLRNRFKLRSTRLHLVLDNARAHTTLESKQLAEELNIDLMFMPPYTPEFNCIEALWSVLKRDFKRRVLDERSVSLSDERFRILLQQSLDAITPTVQKAAARNNNRGFMHLILGKLVSRQTDFVEVDPSDLVSLPESADPDEEYVEEVAEADGSDQVDGLDLDDDVDGAEAEKVGPVAEEEKRDVASESVSDHGVKTPMYYLN